MSQFICQKLREATGRGGLTLAARSVRRPDIEASAMAVVRTIGPWSGPATVKFKQQEDGRLVLLSVKPRFGDSILLAAECGLNMPQLMLDLMEHRQVEPATPEFGRLMVRYQHDVIETVGERV